MKIAYEAGYDEPLHPDPVINTKFEEFAVSNCTHGCKIYRLSYRPEFLVLGHAASYGCVRDKKTILDEVSTP